MTTKPTQPPVITLAPAKVAQLKKTGRLTGRPLRHSVAIESRYIAALTKLVNQMVAQVEREILPVLREAEKDQGATDGFSFDADDSPKKAANKKAASKAAGMVESLQAKFASMFKNRAHTLADGMMQAVTAESATNLNNTISDLSGKMTVGMGFMDGPVGEVVKGGVAENIALIKSIPDNYMARVAGHLEAAALAGNNMTGLIGKIQDAAGITKRRAKNIALDQTRKAYNTINGARMAAAGVKKFEWVHSGGGQRPRHKHITPVSGGGLNGGIYELDKPPNAAEDGDPPYNALPGQMINCKCTMAPVVEFEGAGNEADYTDAPIDFGEPGTAPNILAPAVAYEPVYAKPATFQPAPVSAAIVQKPAIAPSAVLAQAPRAAEKVAAEVTTQQRQVTAAETLKAKTEAQQAALKEKHAILIKQQQALAQPPAPFVAASEIETRQEAPRQAPARQAKPRGKDIPPPEARPKFAPHEIESLVEKIKNDENAYHGSGLKNSLNRFEGERHRDPERFAVLQRAAKDGELLSIHEMATVAEYTGGGYDVNRLYFDERVMKPTNPATQKLKKEYKEYSDALEHSLDKMQKYKSKDPVYRGEDYSGQPIAKAERMAQLTQAFTKNKPVEFGTFLSTSRQGDKAFKGDLRMIIKPTGKNAVHVDRFSWSPTEDEILFNRRSRFKVKKMLKDKDGNDVVWLVEV